MNKFVLTIMLLVGSVSLCFAQTALNVIDTIKTFPELKQGIAYSVIDSQFNYLSTLTVLSKHGVNLEAGYAGVAKNTGDKLVAVISYDLWNAKRAGVTIPVLDLIDIKPGAYVGFGRIAVGSEDTRDGNNQLDVGVSLTAISVKF